MATRTNRIPIRAPRRARQWAITNANVSLIGTAEAFRVGVDLLAGLELELDMQLHNLTASAIRLNVTYRMSGAQQTDEDVVAMGIAWIPQGAIALGGASLPDPVTAHYDWMFHDIRMLKGEGAADQDTTPRNGFVEIRNNSMRKQRENHSTLALIFQLDLMQSTSV